MKTFYNNKIVFGCVLLVFCMLLSFTAAVSFAVNQVYSEYEPGPFEFKASVMEIDLDKNLVVIAEEDIYLRSSKQDGKKIWETILKNSDGKKISIDQLKASDKVLVSGEKSLSGLMEADSITLIKSVAPNLQSKDNQGTASKKKDSAPVYKEGEVWKN